MKEHKINMSRLPVEMHSFRVAKVREAVRFALADGKKIYEQNCIKIPSLIGHVSK